MKIALLSSGKEARVRSIEFFGEDRVRAYEGENIGLTLEEDVTLQRGEVIAGLENAPKPSVSFKGDIFWMSAEPLRLGKRVTLRCATQEVPCAVEKIDKRIDTSTLAVIEENAGILKQNEVGVATFRTEKPVVVENFSLIDELGRFTLEREYNLEGAGIVRDVSIH